MSKESKETPLPRNLCDIGKHGRDTIYRSTPLDRIYEVLGMSRGGGLPKTFKGLFNVDGHRVVVFPSFGSYKGPYKGSRRYKPKRVSGRKYGLTRVFFQLPGGKLVPAGRIAQTKHCGGTGSQRKKRR
jgi:hypothetical protein